MPTMGSRSLRPLSNANTASPGPSFLTCANASLTSTSLLPAAGQRPLRRDRRFSPALHSAGSAPTMRPVSGCATPGTSIWAPNTRLVCTSATPGSSSICDATRSGARLAYEKTSASLDAA